MDYLTTAIVGALAMVSGCSSSGGGASGPQEVAKVTADDAAAKASPAESRGPVYDQAGLLRVDGKGEIYVGRLRRNQPADMMRPSEYCLEDGQLWGGALHRLGRVNVFGLGDDVDSRLAPVALFADKRPSLDAVISALGPCPDGYGEQARRKQMRSDWVADEGGFATTHAKLAKIPYLEAHAHVVLDLHEVLEQSDTATRLRLKNPFNVAISAVDMRLHYEGGPGKPMPTFVAIEPRPVIAPGASVEIEVKRTPTGAAVAPLRKRNNQLYGLQLEGRVGSAEIDVELQVD
jgi:hypothetical protein